LSASGQLRKKSGQPEKPSPAFGRKLYDLVGGLCDAKTSFSNASIGELMTHLEWLAIGDGDPGRVVRGMLWTATEYYLIAWQGSHAIRGITGRLDAPGSTNPTVVRAAVLVGGVYSASL
jgi:hypothetical protein